MKAISYSIQSYLESWKYFLKTKVLLLIILIIAITSISSFFLFSVIWNHSDGIIQSLLGKIEWFNTQGYFANAMSWILKLFGSAMVLILYRYLFYIFCSPILSIISSEVEHHYLLDNQMPVKNNSIGMLESFWRSIRMNGRNFCIEISICGILFLLSVIPLIGFVFSGISFVVSAYFAGISNMDFSLERYYQFGTSLRWISKYKSHILISGIIYMLFFWIPIVGWIVVPVWSVIASTIHYCKIESRNL